MLQTPLYDLIGRSYVSTRRPDPRIITKLVRLIGGSPGATICGVGAGSGNYTNALANGGYEVLV
jgi:2-polyprenyl-3-methyl-5-hydroxy-6-metoxy-1,4-benzoquinol methylase